MTEYDRAPEGSPIKIYDWLENEIELAVDRIRRKKNYAERDMGLTDTGKQHQPKKQQAAPA